MDSIVHAAPSVVFCHAGILQHGETKIDRENRNYLIKPFTELGIIEPVYLDPRTKSFVPGHPTPKSPNNCHRLAEEFHSLLRLSGEELDEALDRWTGEDATRERAQVQAAAEQIARTGGSHADLVRAALEFYAPRFLSGYEEVYTDVADGDRISEEQREALRAAGLEPTLADPSPDALLWNEDGPRRTGCRSGKGPAPGRRGTPRARIARRPADRRQVPSRVCALER
jgi:hypothetical protein